MARRLRSRRGAPGGSGARRCGRRMSFGISGVETAVWCGMVWLGVSEAYGAPASFEGLGMNRRFAAAAMTLFAVAACGSGERTPMAQRGRAVETTTTTPFPSADLVLMTPWTEVLSGSASGTAYKLFQAPASDDSICQAVEFPSVPAATTTTDPVEAELDQATGGKTASCVPRPEIGSRSTDPVELTLGRARSSGFDGPAFIAGVAAFGVTSVSAAGRAGRHPAAVGAGGSFLIDMDGEQAQELKFQANGHWFRCRIEWLAGDPVQDSPVPTS